MRFRGEASCSEVKKGSPIKKKRKELVSPTCMKENMWLLHATCGAIVGIGLLKLYEKIVNAQLEQREIKKLEIFELCGQYYQKIGEAWDHEVKQFKVVYRPLYHCPREAERFEAHYMAVSHFSRWEEKFRPCDVCDMDKTSLGYLLRGPFWRDPAWKVSSRTRPRRDGEVLEHNAERTHEI